MENWYFPYIQAVKPGENIKKATHKSSLLKYKQEVYVISEKIGYDTMQNILIL